MAIGAAAAGAGAVALGNRPASAALGTFVDATTVSDVTYTGATLTNQSAVTVHDGIRRKGEGGDRSTFRVCA